MFQRLAFSSLLLCVLPGFACSGSVDNGADDSEGAFRLPPPVTVPPAVPVISWQFVSCLTADQRTGLGAALLQVMQSGNYYKSSIVVGAVADSQCIGGQERGGIFLASTYGNRTLGLQGLNILPAYKQYAFRVTTTHIDLTAAELWPTLAKRFDDSGTANPTGRYELTSYELPLLNRPKALIHVLDHVTGHNEVTIESDGQMYVDYSTGFFFCEATQHNVLPYSSSNPLIQSVINATAAYVQKNNLYLFGDSACIAAQPLDLSLAPSLKGWQLPFDRLFVDADGNLTLWGGDLIR